MSYPIEHISHSAVMSFLRNPLYFKKKYIDKVEDTSMNPAAAVGKSFHRFAELYYSKFPVDKAIEVATQTFEELCPFVDWGDTGSKEKSLAEFQRSVEFYLNQGIPFPLDYVLAVEKVMEHKVRGLALPLKCVSDLIIKNSAGHISIVDWKTTRSFSKEVPFNYWSQAYINSVLVEKEYGEKVGSFLFVEVKVTENKDKSIGQIQMIEIKMDDEETKKQFRKVRILYQGVLRKIKSERQWLPNPLDMMEGDETWATWEP